MNPLFPLAPLTSDVKHAINQVADRKLDFCDTGRLDARSDDIFVGWNVVGSADTVDFVEEAAYKHRGQQKLAHHLQIVRTY